MKKTVKLIILSLGILLALMVTTQPTKLPSAMLIVPFLLMYVALSLVLALLLAWRSRALTSKHVRKGLLGAALPMLLLVLQSLGQLTVRDVMIIFLLFGVGYFYISRLNTATK